VPFRLRVKNFQSIEDASLDVDGLTVVTGPNNSGKTAMIRAVYGAFTNARGTKYVRHGKASCEVSLDFADGRSLVWEKGEKVNRYVLDGQTLNKVGQGAPPEMTSLGVQPVEAAGRELWPQFAHQFVGQVFLIDEPGSVLAEAISDVTRVGVLNEALRNSQSDRRTAASDLKLRQSDVAKHEQAARKFDGLDDALKLAAEVDALRVDLVDLQRRLDESRRLRDRLQHAQADVDRLHPVRDHGSVDDTLLAKAVKAESALGWVQSASKRWSQAQESHEVAERAVGSVSRIQLPDWDGSTHAQWREASDLSRKHDTYLQSVQSLQRESVDAEGLVASSTSYLSTLLSEAGVCPTCGSETHDEADHG
jgi:exonuclease SbcC